MTGSSAQALDSFRPLEEAGSLQLSASYRLAEPHLLHVAKPVENFTEISYTKSLTIPRSSVHTFLYASNS